MPPSCVVLAHAVRALKIAQLDLHGFIIEELCGELCLVHEGESRHWTPLRVDDFSELTQAHVDRAAALIDTVIRAKVAS